MTAPMTNPKRISEGDDETSAYKLANDGGKRQPKGRKKSIKALQRYAAKAKKKYEDAMQEIDALELENKRLEREKQDRKDLCPILGDAAIKAAAEDASFRSAVLDHLKKKLSERNFAKLKKLLQVQCDEQQPADQVAVSSSQDSAGPSLIEGRDSRARKSRRSEAQDVDQRLAAITGNNQADVPKTSATQPYTDATVNEAKPSGKPSPFASLQQTKVAKKSE